MTRLASLCKPVVSDENVDALPRLPQKTGFFAQVLYPVRANTTAARLKAKLQTVAPHISHACRPGALRRRVASFITASEDGSNEQDNSSTADR